MFCHIDFETRSPQDLEDVGVDRYTRDPDAGVWCMAYSYGEDETVHLWHPGLGKNPGIFFPLGFEGGQVVAHNAQFELAVWNNIMVPKYRWPRLDPAKVLCTMSMGYSMALPGKLDNMAAALGITERKDLAGSRLATQMSRPRGDYREESGDYVYHWWDEPEKLEKLYAYCQQDVRVEREVFKRLVHLPPDERHLWVVDFAINQRGMYVDLPAINAALNIVDIEQDRLAKELHTLTDGNVSFPSQVKALTEWIVMRGVPLEGLAKQNVVDLLTQDFIPEDVRRAVEIRQEYAKTSVAKLAKIRDSVSDDHRIKGILQYHSAGTGRWGGRRIQPQNMPRPKLKQKEIERLLEYMTTHRPATSIEYIELLYGHPMNVISDCLRGVLTAAPGHKLLAGDYSNIEGRTVAWLANETWKLQAFRDFDAGIGHDIYLLAAAKIYSKPVSDFTKSSPERQIGKVAELACGYQGGVGAFQTMATTYGVKVPDEEAEAIKTAWRESHPRICQLWYDLEEAALDAVGHPGTICSAANGKIKFKMSGSFLFCLLPSGRALCYPYARIAEKETWWGAVKDTVHYKAVDDRTKQWVETFTYGGKLTENIIQAIARDILADAIVKVAGAGWNIVLHVHDEIVVETVDGKVFDFIECMSQQPPWSAGLPIAVEGWAGFRYRK